MSRFFINLFNDRFLTQDKKMPLNLESMFVRVASIFTSGDTTTFKNKDIKYDMAH